MKLTHADWVRLGDVADTIHDWAVTALAAILVGLILAPLCVTTLLLLFSKIGNL